MDVTLPTAFCTTCRRDVIVTSDLNEHDAWCYACLRCGGPITVDEEKFRQRTAQTLSAMGYEIEGYAAGGGCGSGSCSCGGSR